MLFVAYLIDQGKQSSTIKSYVSAMKAVLAEANIKPNENTYLLNALTRANRLVNDRMVLKMPIHKDLLNIILKKVKSRFLNEGQLHLSILYTTMLATAYYGLFRISELAMSQHSVKACDIHIGENKRKMFFILRSSKTHGPNDPPQIITITSMDPDSQPAIQLEEVDLSLCPFNLLQQYIDYRPRYKLITEPFFIYRDHSGVPPGNMRAVLKVALTTVNYDPKYFGFYQLRSGRAMDLMKLGLSVETIKKLG